MSGEYSGMDANRPDEVSREWTNYKLYCALHKPLCTAEKIKKFIRAGADVNCKDHEGRTLLHHIATIANCDWDSIKMILKSGANVNARDGNSNTPLHVAARYSENNFKFINELILYGSEINARNNEGNTPLHLAAGSFCNWNVVRKLADAGAKVNARNLAGNTPLHLAIELLRSNTASELLICGADVNIRNGAGNMPLHLALKRLPHGYIVNEILNAGASVNDRDGDGFTPLHMAVANISLAANRLVSMGAVASAVDYTGDTPRNYIENSIGLGPILDSVESDFITRVQWTNPHLHLAAQSVECQEQVRIVLLSMIEAETQDYSGKTPLHHAAKNPICNLKTIKALLKRGCLVNSVDLEGYSPLHYAVLRDTINLPIIETLLDQGAKVGLVNRFGENVLHCALKNGTIEREDLLTCFRMLVKFAIIQNEFLSHRFCYELNYKLPEMFAYKTECLEERKRLKSFPIDNHKSMADFANGKEDRPVTQVEQALQVLVSNSFPIYLDAILMNIEKKHLLEKILTKDVYAVYKLPLEAKSVVLKYYCVRYLADLLSKMDLLNMLIAFDH